MSVSEKDGEHLKHVVRKLSFSPTNLSCMSLDCGKRAEKPAVWGLNITWAALLHWTVPHILWLRARENVVTLDISPSLTCVMSDWANVRGASSPNNVLLLSLHVLHALSRRLLHECWRRLPPAVCFIWENNNFLKLCRRDSPEIFWSVKTVCLSNLRLMKICRLLVNFLE